MGVGAWSVSETINSSLISKTWAVSTSAATIRGVRITVPTLEEAITHALGRVAEGRGFTFFTLNLDHLAKLDDNSAFRDAYLRADFVSADGWPIVWLARRQGAPLERVCGADLVAPLCSAAAATGVPVAFIGPQPDAQAAGIAALKARSPKLTVAFAAAPELAAEPAAATVHAVADRLNASGARIAFLGLGAPKQEVLADKLARLCPTIGFIGVGAALDFLSGRSQRAPEWAQRANLEWAWRLSREPRRLALRYALSAIAFAKAIPEALT